ncbi:MAG: type II toxin-antitoxin system RelE/ParE family toxin [Roseitalea sp.]|nr:type II toxin-antitoxin system RelE/ParE family toxin [Roseitalea sp.]MBO6953380.1 type II toxin-antitoxin system RelE/ParE family toxin [Rhizobiaceae bacterium]MBO6593851.1 type II toxin-antitoxin system RelE/ParE family toxin [Roseitalea sp.]MBO6601124.1 type II toxin-antitoxin system RelE/ParE family toxin [Roseitalea sp.]MBO6613856.1 type II toxin-antitoxin system RelE/ParE family toxin [Roseitalea sp.]
MARFLLSPRAEQDIGDIWRTIVVENPAAADKLVRRFFEKFELAATQPNMGAPRPELSQTARILIEGSYILIYEPLADCVLIVAVVHGARDPASWL